jgi:hypothetical protein
MGSGQKGIFKAFFKGGLEKAFSFILFKKCIKKALFQICLFLTKRETRHGKWSLIV